MTDDFADILEFLAERPPHLTVIGDVILDRWVRGRARRLSREAPVPVVDIAEAEDAAGGAANTAVNLAAMGATVRLIAAVGDDGEGRALRQLLTAAGVDVSGVIVREGASTAVKTRIVGEDQLLVRADRRAEPPLTVADRAELAAVAATIGATDAIVICDYDGGLFTPELQIPDIRRPPHLIVDAHDLRRWRPLRPDIVTPNAAEAAGLLGIPLVGDRPEAVASLASRLVAESGAASAVVTLDVDGTVVIEGGRVTARTSARPVAEQQASGAGDTFTAALAIATSLGADLARAAAFAQRAADVVVQRPGTAVCARADLERVLGAGDEDLQTAEELRVLIARERAAGRRVVFTNGCFDLIHRGHTTHLRQAKELGDVLVVALNDDDSVRRLKGPGRPVNTLAERAAVLQALGCVDFVTSFAEDSPAALLEDLRPEIYAKGGDYTPEMLTESAVVAAYGGEVRILDYLPERSTSGLVRRITERAG
jgi:rfaE bifunctional protein kinase chain/domain/rfaE bifunctional protein nucleotidyltransferase chain/domain